MPVNRLPFRTVEDPWRQDCIACWPHPLVINQMGGLMSEEGFQKPGAFNVRVMSAHVDWNLAVAFCSSKIPSVAITMQQV